MLSPQKVGGAAASLSSLKYVQGEAFELGGGKVSVIEFWATWCPPCKIAIPHLNKLYVENYKAKGVQLVGVTKEDEGTVKPFIAERKHQFTYPVAIDSSGGCLLSRGRLHLHRDLCCASPLRVVRTTSCAPALACARTVLILGQDTVRSACGSGRAVRARLSGPLSDRLTGGPSRACACACAQVPSARAILATESQLLSLSITKATYNGRYV